MLLYLMILMTNFIGGQEGGNPDKPCFHGCRIAVPPFTGIYGCLDAGLELTITFFLVSSYYMCCGEISL